MRQIQASEAKTRFLQLLDDVERGDTLIITRHGRHIAQLIPVAGAERERVDRAIARIYALRRRTGRVTADELIAARDEGRKR